MSQHQQLPTEQQAFAVTNPGHSLEQISIPVKQASSNEVVVEVYSSSINPLDWKLRDANLWGLQVPYVLGYDFSGIVTSVGSNVNKFKVGDKVYGRGGGAYTTYITVPETAITHIKNIPLELGGAYGVAYLSAYDGLHITDDLNKRKGQTIYVAGGAGGVGHFAVQLAKAAGLTVISSGSKQSSLDLLKQLGVDHIIDYSKQDVVKEVLRITNNKGVDIVYDPTYSTSSYVQSASVVAQNGHWIRLGIGYPDDTEAVKVVQQRNATVGYADLARYIVNPEYIAKLPTLTRGLDLADELYAKNLIKPYISNTYQYTLQDVNRALDELKQGKTNLGKAIIKHK